MTVKDIVNELYFKDISWNKTFENIIYFLSDNLTDYNNLR